VVVGLPGVFTPLSASVAEGGGGEGAGGVWGRRGACSGGYVPSHASCVWAAESGTVARYRGGVGFAGARGALSWVAGRWAGSEDCGL